MALNVCSSCTVVGLCVKQLADHRENYVNVQHAPPHIMRTALDWELNLCLKAGAVHSVAALAAGMPCLTLSNLLLFPLSRYLSAMCSLCVLKALPCSTHSSMCSCQGAPICVADSGSTFLHSTVLQSVVPQNLAWIQSLGICPRYNQLHKAG